MFNQTQYENPKLYQFKSALEEILFKVRNELEDLKKADPQ